MCYSITGFVETLSNLFKGGTMMKVTVLADNDTLVRINFQVEPALSFYVEEGDKRSSSTSASATCS